MSACFCFCSDFSDEPLIDIIIIIIISALISIRDNDTIVGSRLIGLRLGYYLSSGWIQRCGYRGTGTGSG
jgi:hypothetical protein